MRSPDGARKMGYRIKTVSELTGIPKNTLVAWERRYGILNPDRLPNGYRLYSDKDIAILTQIKSVLADGFRISDAVEIINREPPAEPAYEPGSPEQDMFEALRGQLAGALLGYDRARADVIVRRLGAMPHTTAIEAVYFPLLREVGDGWASGTVSVAQEHFVAAYVRERLTGMLMGLGCGPAHGLHVACTTFPGDRHELGVLGLAVRLAADGFRVSYLGADTPVGDLGRFAAEVRPGWLCVSVILQADLRAVVAYARELRALCQAETNIAIGGAGLPELDNTPVNGVVFVRDWWSLSLLANAIRP